MTSTTLIGKAQSQSALTAKFDKHGDLGLFGVPERFRFKERVTVIEERAIKFLYFDCIVNFAGIPFHDKMSQPRSAKLDTQGTDPFKTYALQRPISLPSYLKRLSLRGLPKSYRWQGAFKLLQNFKNIESRPIPSFRC